MTQDSQQPNVERVGYGEQYTDAELDQVVEQALVYMCACPAQVADTIRKLRALLRYQQNCLADPKADPKVHTAIAQSTMAAHRIMEDCLQTVMELEQWDRKTLTMPEGLRQRQVQDVMSDGRP